MAQLTDDAFAFGGDLMRIEQALALVSARVPAIEAVESVPLRQADGRVLARALMAPVALPVFDNSAVDGYAVAFDALAPTGESVLPVAGRIAAGQASVEKVQAGVTVRIFTGAPMPPGCDTVFMQEDVRVLEGGHVALPPGLKRGANTRPRGEDVEEGSLVLAAGRRLDPRDIALLAALGVESVSVRRQPRVAVFSTGDELVEPGAPLGQAKLYDSNRFSLMALLARAGCGVTDLGILPDSFEATAARLSEAARGHDLVVTSGGVSTGEEDHVKAALSARGTLHHWRLAIKPGRPVVLGSLGGGTAFVGLPGNPVAVFVTFAHVLRPIIAALSGAEVTPLPRQSVTADFTYRKKAGRREYVRVSLHQDGARLVARKYPVDGAGVLTSLTQTDGLVELAEETLVVSPGDLVPFLDYRLMF